MACFYDASAIALRFVTPTLLQALSLLNPILGLLLAAWSLMFLLRIVLTWYPQVDLNAAPWAVIALPTEPVLALTRRVVSPIGGVDVTPVIWVGIVSLIRELLVGQQEVFTMVLLRAQSIG